jgi:PEP-CTERM motif
MKLITAIFLAAMATTVQAGQMPITVDFSGSTAPFEFRNNCSGGGNEWSWGFGGPPAPWHIIGFCGHDGLQLPQVVIRHQYGHPFTLLSFDADRPMWVRSSRGGLVYTQPDFIGVVETPYGEENLYDYTEDLSFLTDPSHSVSQFWTNLQWVTICPDCDPVNGPGGHYVGLIDNVRFSIQVPEPAPLTLIGIALVGLTFTRRRKR